MSFEVSAWYGLHTGGTKFYHVITVKSLHDRKSFSIEHYGKAQVYVGIGKAATGTITVRSADNNLSAGSGKKAEKLGRGYTDDIKEEVTFSGPLSELRNHLYSVLGSGAYRQACNIINQVFTDDDRSSAIPTPAPAPAMAMLPVDHEDYGTW